MDTILHDAAGRFLCFGVFVSERILLAPNIAAEYWYRGERITRILRRSPRHHFVLLEGVATRPPNEHMFPLLLLVDEEEPLRAVRQPCKVETHDASYELTVQRWVCSEDAAYRLQLSTRADPRLNGRAVTVEDGTKLLGMAISPVGFSGMLLCVPADIVAAHMRASRTAPPPYSRMSPPIMLQYVDDSTCTHVECGRLRGHFRTADRRAELGMDTWFEAVDKARGSLHVSGSDGPSAILRYEPFVQLGNYVFQHDVFGKVECVYEDEDLEDADEVISDYPSRVLKAVNGCEVTSFASLVDILRRHQAVRTFALQWCDDLVREFPAEVLEGATYGDELSPFALLWFGTHKEKEEEENETDETDDDDESCADPCCMVLEVHEAFLHKT